LQNLTKLTTAQLAAQFNVDYCRGVYSILENIMLQVGRNAANICVLRGEGMGFESIFKPVDHEQESPHLTGWPAMRDTEHELHSVKGLILLTDMTVV
jgi:hypothetical protein